MKALYEVFDEFELAKNKKERMDVISKNLSQTLVDVLKLAYHPNIQWKIKELPENYRVPTDMLPGITHDSINGQIRRMYMFMVGDATAEKLKGTEGKDLHKSYTVTEEQITKYNKL